jgi:hypothetical protein
MFHIKQILSIFLNKKFVGFKTNLLAKWYCPILAKEPDKLSEPFAFLPCHFDYNDVKITL